MFMKNLSLKAFIFIVIIGIFTIFSLAIFLKVSHNYKTDEKKEFIAEIDYLSKVTSDMIKKSETGMVNEAKVIANLESVYYAFKEKRYLSDKWEMSGDKVEIKTKETTELEYKKLMSSVINTIYQSGIGHLQGEKMLALYDENLNRVASSYDFPEKFLDTGREVYMEAAIGGTAGRLSVDAAEMSVIEEKDNEIMVKGIAPIGKYIRFTSNNVYGIVVLGEYLNRAFLEEMKKLTNRDLIIVKGNNIIVSTLEDSHDVVNLGKEGIAPADEDFFYREININGKKGGFSLFALRGYSGEVVAYIGVGSLFKGEKGAYTKSIIDFIIFEAVAFLIIAGLFYIILRNQYQIFTTILSKVAEIRSGNYGNKITMEARHEFQVMIEGINNLSEAVYNRENKLREMNAKLEINVAERTKELNQMVHKMKGIERLAAVIYTEKDINKTIEYILEAITQRDELNYSKAVFFLYDQETCNLTAKGAAEENAVVNVGTEDNIITEAFFAQKIKESRGEYPIKIDDGRIMENYIILPIYYESNTFGILAIEQIEKFSNEDWEVLNIFMNNLAVYFETLRLRQDDLKSNQLKTLVKISSGIVHELRTPITTIRGLSSILMSKYADDSRVNQYVKVIIAETKRIDGMAADLLVYAEGKAPKGAWTELNINAVIGEAIAEMDYDLRANNFDVSFETTDEIIMYPGDKKKLRQVFINLVKNAIEAGKGYEDSLKIKVNKIANEILIEIIDNGVGVKSDIADRVFEPLVTSKIQGTGLGLTIAKDVLDRHCKSTISIETLKDEKEKTKVTILLKKY